jgi:hypothetical protein
MTMTSMKNMIPVTGVLKEAEISAATLRPTSTLILLLGSCRYYPINLLHTAPGEWQDPPVLRAVPKRERQRP